MSNGFTIKDGTSGVRRKGLKLVNVCFSCCSGVSLSGLTTGGSTGLRVNDAEFMSEGFICFSLVCFGTRTSFLFDDIFVLLTEITDLSVLST